MKKTLLLITTLAVLISESDAQSTKKTTITKMEKEFLSNQVDGIYAKFETSKGIIYTNLDYNKAPLTVASFVGLAEGKIKNTAKAEGVPFFDGLTFHRVEPGFVIQGGDPSGNGSGGPGYKFNDEPVTESYLKGMLAMANAGPNTNGSQFFIMLADAPTLPKSYTIFGKVLMGQEVVDAIAKNDTIKKVTIMRKGKESENFDAAKRFTDEQAIVAKKQIEKEAEAKIIAEKMMKEYTNVTPSGLRYLVITEGTGAKPVATSNVKVHYTGTFLDGKVFDSSVQRGQPIDFGLNQVIKGWTEGVQLMKEGAKYKFYIPYTLAYGEQGYPGAIPPKSDLIFEVELIKIN